MTTLTFVAWLNVVLHGIGLAFAAIGMRPGTPAVPLAERVDYLAASPLGWMLGWAVWMLCVPAVVAFFAIAAQRLGESAWLGRLACSVVLAAGAIDLCCDTVFLIALPRLAAERPLPESLFLTVERATGAISLIVANGLYTMGTLLMTITLHQRPRVSTWLLAAGYGVTLFGALLAAAGCTGIAWHVEWATGPTLGLFCIFTLLVAHELSAAEVES
ncbi:MAG: hypothetical protein FJ303_04530 [Planctomycetes bacterium]|nr:hypothetical protein [Planctomycetota bacterium]